MKPDLTYCPNSSRPLTRFIYFPEKNPGVLSKPKRILKNLYLNNFLYFSKKILIPHNSG